MTLLVVLSLILIEICLEMVPIITELVLIIFLLKQSFTLFREQNTINCILITVVTFTVLYWLINLNKNFKHTRLVEQITAILM